MKYLFWLIIRRWNILIIPESENKCRNALLIALNQRIYKLMDSSLNERIIMQIRQQSINYFKLAFPY